jgi:hypothetical protein
MPRKEKKFHFIYKTTNTITGRYYYGMHSTSNLEDGYLGSGKRLRYSVNKYGEDAHQREILEFYNTREDLAKREREIVNLNEIAKEDCMNIKIGGEGGGGFYNEEHRKKMTYLGIKAFQKKIKEDIEFREKFCKAISKSLTGEKNPMYGKKHSDISKRKLSISNKGSNNSQYGTCWINKDDKSIKIKKEELQEYLNRGWNKGRTIPKLRKDNNITKICPNCGIKFIVWYNKRNTICCSHKCGQSFRHKK